MKKMTPLAASLLAIALAGCGGGDGGNSSPVAGVNDANGGAAQTSGGTAQTGGSGTQAQFPLRSTKQGDERTYEVVDTFSNGSKVINYVRTVQAVLNADGSGEKQFFDASGKLFSTEVRSYDENGLLSRYSTLSNVTCKYDAKRSSFTSPMSVGQTFMNKITDNCDNGYSAAIDETGTIVGAETITVHGASYSTLKAIVTENGMVTPPGTEPAYSYSYTRTEWIEPSLGLRVKEDTSYTLAASPDGIYQTTRSATLMSYVNK